MLIMPKTCRSNGNRVAGTLDGAGRLTRKAIVVEHGK
jgi:hypothetical protein